jgi:hypothetical protein
VPVFQPGKSATENSLVATDKSIVVENNYGYADWSSTMNGQTTTPGITRIDIDANGTCQEAWTNESISIPSLVTKMSLANGLIYTYTKPRVPTPSIPGTSPRSTSAQARCSTASSRGPVSSTTTTTRPYSSVRTARSASACSAASSPCTTSRHTRRPRLKCNELGGLPSLRLGRAGMSRAAAVVSTCWLWHRVSRRGSVRVWPSTSA